MEESDIIYLQGERHLRHLIFATLFCLTALAFTAVGVTACAKINKKLGLKDDNLIEEIIENVVEENLGIKVDFTPSSKES